MQGARGTRGFEETGGSTVSLKKAGNWKRSQEQGGDQRDQSFFSAGLIASALQQ